LTHSAEQQSRYANRDATASAHELAGDLHFKAGKEHAAAGNDERANEHFQKASGHFKTAKVLSGCDAGDAAGVGGGNPVVKNPLGSDPSASDKSKFNQLRQDNLREGGGAATGDYLGQLAQLRPDGQCQCPMCKNFFIPEDSVSGKNSAQVTCPRCTGSFYLDTGRSIGTPSVE
jgi:hypothetical protein